MFTDGVMIMFNVGNQIAISPQPILRNAMRGNGLVMAHLHRLHRIVEVIILDKRQRLDTLWGFPCPDDLWGRVIIGGDPRVGLLLRAQTAIKQAAKTGYGASRAYSRAISS